jgi:hypothetical protein
MVTPMPDPAYLSVDGITFPADLVRNRQVIHMISRATGMTPWYIRQMLRIGQTPRNAIARKAFLEAIRPHSCQIPVDTA